MERFFVATNSSGNEGVLLCDRATIAIFEDLDKAEKFVNYGNQGQRSSAESQASAVIHWMSYRPLILKVEAETEKEICALVTKMLMDSEGKATSMRLSSIAGSMNIVKIVDFEAFKQYYLKDIEIPTH